MATEQSRETPAFELTSFRCTYGRIVVEGRWSGVRGLRFVRPTLIVGGRELLATLDHKPWAPEARLWRAAFRWDGPEPRAQDTALAVTPSLVLPLVAGGEVPRTLPREVSSTTTFEPASLRAVTAPAARAVPTPTTAPAARSTPARATVPAARPVPPPAPDPPGREHDRELAALRNEHADALEEQARELARLQDHQRGQAEREREATRTAEERAAELAAAREAAETARRQRDDALVANGALQRHLDGLLASAPVPGPPRALTAPERPGRASPSRFDFWAIRTVGVITAGSFLLLLVLLVRVFV